MKFNKLLDLICEKYEDESFKAQFEGAFRLVFDIDAEDIISKDSTKHSSYGYRMGIGGLSIGNPWFTPENAESTMHNKFFIIYKTKRYQVFVETHAWKQEPTEEDFKNANAGKNKSNSVSLKPFDFSKPMSATGYVRYDDMEYNWETDKMEEVDEHLQPDIHNYPNHFRFNNLVQLAQKVKSIIDGHDKKKTNRKSPLRPDTVKPKSPVMPNKPVLV